MRNSKKARAAGMQGMSSTSQAGDGRDRGPGQAPKGLVGHCQDVGFDSKTDRKSLGA